MTDEREQAMDDFAADEDSNSPQNEAGKKKTRGARADEVKTRLTLVTESEHPFCELLTELKKRGIKDVDPNIIVREALAKVDPAWWQEKLEALTPLEYKLTAALNDPNMREKLTSLLASQKISSDSSSAPTSLQ